MRPWSLITKILLATFVLPGCIAVHADGTLSKVPTRPGVTTTLYWEATENTTATVFIFPGGGGGFGRVEGGKPTSQNFLVRSVQHFLTNGFNVAIFGRPSDSEDLDYADRISESHLTDVRMVMEAVKARNSSPIWVVGTSRGTVSATATAIAMQDSIAGLVLTSSVVNYKRPGAVPKQDPSRRSSFSRLIRPVRRRRGARDGRTRQHALRPNSYGTDIVTAPVAAATRGRCFGS